MNLYITNRRQNMDYSFIRKNIDDVNKIIDDECVKADRNRQEVTLVAVSKTKPVEMLQVAYDYGCRDFGENKVQELVDKYEVLPKDIRWHMIGHLQTNKVKYIVDKVYMIHSVDSLKLANEISKEAVKKNVTVNILIEVNVANEETKFGTTCDEVKELVREIAKLSNISIKGLMTIAPIVDNAEENRTYFRKLKELAVDIDSENIDNVSMKFLSMGMTGDYPVAVSEGATYVRVGTGIFGARNYMTTNGKEI
jgi:pyridoxal phosphate enzyme (YggS family)